MKKNTILGIVLSLSVTVSGFAQVPEKIIEQLNLTGEQVEKVNNLILRYDKTNEQIEIQIDEYDLVIRKELIKDQLEMAVLEENTRKMYKFIMDQEIAYYKFICELKKVLTVKQFRLWEMVQDEECGDSAIYINDRPVLMH